MCEILCKDNANRAQNIKFHLNIMPRCSLSYLKIMQIGRRMLSLAEYSALAWRISQKIVRSCCWRLLFLAVPCVNAAFGLRCKAVLFIIMCRLC